MSKKNGIIFPKVEATVKWFDDAKGYGFILYKGQDYFVHYKDIRMKGRRTLLKDQKVRFIPLTSKAGKPIATEVEVYETI